MYSNVFPKVERELIATYALSFSRTVTNCREAFSNAGQQWQRWDRGRETVISESGPARSTVGGPMEESTFR